MRQENGRLSARVAEVEVGGREEDDWIGLCTCDGRGEKEGGSLECWIEVFQIRRDDSTTVPLSASSPLSCPPPPPARESIQAELSAAKSKAAALSKEKAEMTEAHERALASLREVSGRVCVYVCVCGIGLVLCGVFLSKEIDGRACVVWVTNRSLRPRRRRCRRLWRRSRGRRRYVSHSMLLTATMHACKHT